MLKKTDDYQPDDEANKAADESVGDRESKMADDGEAYDDETDPVSATIIVQIFVGVQDGLIGDHTYRIGKLRAKWLDYSRLFVTRTPIS